MTRSRLPVTVIIPTRNEAENLPECLRSVRHFAQVIVVDSQSTDGTAALAEQAGAEVHQFHYRGGWPKKRQWALENLPIHNNWVLLLDADERVTPALRRELAEIIRSEKPHDGYWITLRLVFLGKVLRHGASGLKKLSFFRRGHGRFECLIAEQDDTMSDVEIHEHLLMEGSEGECRAALLHHNHHDLFRYIQKHNEYSSWSAELAWRRRRGIASEGARRPSALGTQADRRRLLMNAVWRLPAMGVLFPVLRFFWFYIVRLGFLDGVAGYYYCGFKAVQAFHIAAKVQEKQTRRTGYVPCPPRTETPPNSTGGGSD